MTASAATATTAAAVLEELAALEDPKVRAVNERHGDDHGVNLTKLRAVAKALKTNRELAGELWATGDTAGRLVALLISRPKQYTVAELDEMLRDARVPKVNDWLVNYLVKKHPAVDEMRVAWFPDTDPRVAGAGWALTSTKIGQDPAALVLVSLLDQIEAEMPSAPENLQWAMNECLATIGIHSPELRARAIDIGERLEILKDYPTSPGCTSPFAPIWIAEIVRRREG